VKDLDTSTLRLFVLVAECQSFSRAASHANLVVAAISQRMLDLERLAGEALFYRHSRGIILTQAGQTMLRHSREILLQIDQIQADLAVHSRSGRASIRIGANACAALCFLPAELARFLESFPKARIQLHELTSSETTMALREGTLDLGLFFSSESHEGLEVHHYRRDRLTVVVVRDHPLCSKKSATLADVLPYEIIGLSSGGVVWSLLADKALRPMRHRLRVQSFDAVIRLVEAGLGIGILPDSVARFHADRGLKRIPLAEPWAELALMVGVRSARTLVLPARRLFEQLTATHDID
jgi:DNA-binding transcriptional LysR family regulator